MAGVEDSGKLGGLWAFAVALYDRPGVREACLAAQERLGADIDILLWTAWCGRAGRALAAADIERAVTLACPWRGVIEPLRAARRQAKSLGRTELAAAILALELQGEAAELASLEQVSGLETQDMPIKENILIYLRSLGVPRAELFDIARIVSSAADL